MYHDLIYDILYTKKKSTWRVRLKNNCKNENLILIDKSLFLEFWTQNYKYRQLFIQPLIYKKLDQNVDIENFLNRQKIGCQLYKSV